MTKKILLISAAIFLIWQASLLVFSIHFMDTKSVGKIIFVGWLINMYITGIFAFSGFALPTQKLLPNSYYHISKPKLLKKAYRFFGVEIFRKALLATIWRNKQQQKAFFNGKLEGLEQLSEKSKKSEFGHLIPLFLLILVGIYLISLGLYTLAFFTLLFNFVGNFYPVLLQRHHRMRIQKIEERLKQTGLSA